MRRNPPRNRAGLPAAQGLYDPVHEHDGCGMGFVAHLRGTRSREVVSNALRLLENLEHRSAVGSDAASSDGSGILLQLPHAFLRTTCAKAHIAVPEAGQYGVGMFFLPRAWDRAGQRIIEREVEDIARGLACRPLGWRNVPVNERFIGRTARRARPCIRQFFVAPEGVDLEPHDGSAFERTLYVMRRHIEKAAPRLASATGEQLYVASLSSRTIVYKGLVRPSLLSSFYPDLADPSVASGLALVHSRFSTNTFPTWSRAHPYRFLCHNGEINTLSGNLRWMGVAEEQMSSPRLPNVEELFPLIADGQSDSASLDNALELLVQGGRTLPHAMMMLIPEAWEGDSTMTPERRAFFEYHASLMEPWDGPAAVAFTDGRKIGAMLDRNGLRPGRYVVTDDDFVILSSEAGALPVPSKTCARRVACVPAACCSSTRRKDASSMVKSSRASSRDCIRISAGLLSSASSSRTAPLSCLTRVRPNALTERQMAFGYTSEDLHTLVAPMAATGEEPIGSMGNDTLARRAVRTPATALWLLPATLRAGHQPGDRSDPRTAGDVVRHEPGAQAQLAGRHAGTRAADPHRPAGTQRRAVRRADERPASEPQGSRNAVPRVGRRCGAGARGRGARQCSRDGGTVGMRSC